MSGELRRRAAEVPVRMRNVRTGARINQEAALEQLSIRGIAVVGAYGAFQAAELKQTLRQLEAMNPDCADAVALIINTAISGIASRVQRYAMETD